MAATVSGQWGYSVPLDDTNGTTRPAASRSNPNEIRSLSRQNSAWDLQSDSEATKTRKVTTRAAHAGASRKRSRNALRDPKRDRSEKREEGNVDDSAWIHRDKLAQIEIREMQEAGIPVRHSQQRSMSAGPGSEFDPHSRSASRSEPKRPASSDRPNDDPVYDDEPMTGYGSLERKRVSTIPAADEEEAVEVDSDDRATGESAAEPPMVNGSRHVLRPSTSRIPIVTKSPGGVPSDGAVRDSPRSRAGSSAHANNWDDLQYARPGRSGSMSSQVLLDDTDTDGMKKTPPGSAKHNPARGDPTPPKTKTPPKSMPGARKASGSVARPGSSQGTKSRLPAATKRPGSSQGHKAQTSVGYTWQPPDGDAPWITNMYKPDPRLPPDQQMLPTHMKRMMQEQWEKEGKAGTAYDRQFGLLNDESNHQPRSPEKSPERKPEHLELQEFSRPAEDQSPTSPSAYPGSPTSPHDVKADAHNARPSTSGGYRITPTIPATPHMPRLPIPSPQPMPHNESMNHSAPQNPTLDEKDDADSGGGCCCVMM